MGDACKARRGQKQQARLTQSAVHRLVGWIKTQENYVLVTRSELEGSVVNQIRELCGKFFLLFRI